MKKQLLFTMMLLVASLVQLAAQEPSISMTTEKTSGTPITLEFRGNTTIEIDFGAGRESFTIGLNNYKITRNLAGNSKQIKIYGDDVIALYCKDLNLSALDV
jgi:hypothetical protein